MTTLDSRPFVNPRYTISDNVRTLDEMIQSFFQNDQGIEAKPDHWRPIVQPKIVQGKSEVSPLKVRRRPADISTSNIVRPTTKGHRKDVSVQFVPDTAERYRTAPLPELPNNNTPDKRVVHPSKTPATKPETKSLGPEVQRRMQIAQESQNQSLTLDDMMKVQSKLPPVAPLKIRKRHIEAPPVTVEPNFRAIPVPRKRKSSLQKLKRYISRQKAFVLTPYTDMRQSQRYSKYGPQRFPDDRERPQPIVTPEWGPKREPFDVYHSDNFAEAYDEPEERRRRNTARPQNRPYLNWPQHSGTCKIASQPILANSDSVQDAKTAQYIRVLPHEHQAYEKQSFDEADWPLPSIRMYDGLSRDRPPLITRTVQHHATRNLRLSQLAGINQARAFGNS